jgi:histidinol-phosphatase
MSESGTLLDAVTDLAKRCGEIAAGYFGKALDVEAKDNGSPVTIADRNTEAYAREWITQRFPTDGIIGEEFGTIRPSAKRQWVIDPIDGTATFIRGVPLWGTLVAVMEDDSPIAGAAYCPIVKDLVSAAPGEGCWWNGCRAFTSSVDSLAVATVLTTDDAFRAAPARLNAWENLRTAAGLSRTWGDCYGYILVATGRAEAMVDGALSVWDAAPVMPIIQEAGGVFTDWSGRATPSGNSAIATNGALASTIRNLLVYNRD